MLLQVLFVIVGVCAVAFTAYAGYQLFQEYHAGGAAAHAPVPAARYRFTQVVTGVLLTVLAYIGFRWARERRQRLLAQQAA